MNDNGFNVLKDLFSEAHANLKDVSERLTVANRMLEQALIGESAQRMRADAYKVEIDRLRSLKQENQQ